MSNFEFLEFMARLLLTNFAFLLAGCLPRFSTTIHEPKSSSSTRCYIVGYGSFNTSCLVVAILSVAVATKSLPCMSIVSTIVANVWESSYSTLCIWFSTLIFNTKDLVKLTHTANLANSPLVLFSVI